MHPDRESVNHGAGPDPVVALVGAPNAGKTTLYNWITNSRYRVVNYPGSTVEYAVGTAAPRMGARFYAIDTPGTYSLSPKGEDEEVTLKALLHQHEIGAVSHVIVVVDGTQMKRHLLLVRQLQETGLPVIAVVTMNDLLQKSGWKLDHELLARELGCRVVLFDGVLGKGLADISAAIGATPRADKFIIKPAPWTTARLDEESKRAETLAGRALVGGGTAGAKPVSLYASTRRADRFFLHPLLGPLLFLAIMAALFTSIYSLAAPAMDLIDGSFARLAASIHGFAPESLLASFVADGIVLGMGAVLVFVPQIFILFVGIGLLEGSGYLARAAALIDRPLAKMGMSGRSFVPLLSGFACAVPAMMASRNLSSRRDRMITNFIIPLMQCSARLPVYALLLGLLFAGKPAWTAGLAMTGIYVGAIIIGALAAGVLNKILKQERPSLFMLELPLYRRPRLWNLVVQSAKRTMSYVKGAGPIIFVIALLIWVGSSFPQVDPGTVHPDGTPVSQLEQSFLGRAGHWLTPITAPMGADWRVGVGLLSAFAAREVFVATLAIIFNVEGGADNTAGLLDTLAKARWPDGGALFTPASVLALLVFFMIALQCMSTFAIARKESGSWSFALTQLVGLNVLAYALAVLVFQSARALGL